MAILNPRFVFQTLRLKSSIYGNKTLEREEIESEINVLDSNVLFLYLDLA